MNNLEKYTRIFMDVFQVSEEKTEEMEYKKDSWDSVGHMMLISALEEAYDIELETDDIMAFDSYKIGLEMLKRYGIEI